MTAAHFFADDVAGERIVLRGEDARHAVRVLRIAPGETITVSDGRGAVVEAVVAQTGSDLVADVRARRSEPRPSPSVHVFHAIPKTGKLDMVVQKLTEVGVDAVTPFPGDRSVARWNERKSADQTRRLAAIARGAAMQSRRVWLPEIHAPARLTDLALPAPTFVLHEEAIERLRHLLPDHLPETVGIVVGPEGGLSQKEVSRLVESGAQTVSLGPLVLRTETAGLAAAVVILERYGRIG